MPKIRSKRLQYPSGWDIIEPTLTALQSEMRLAEQADGEGKRKEETVWPIFRLHHQRSRYVYEQFYVKKAISRELYDFCLREGFADKDLIAKWKKQGYEKLCCLRCVQTKDTNFGTTCICRVPKKKKKNSNNSTDNNAEEDAEVEDKQVECKHCGCHGCAS
jgi:bud site selection protein 31